MILCGIMNTALKMHEIEHAHFIRTDEEQNRSNSKKGERRHCSFRMNINDTFSPMCAKCNFTTYTRLRLSFWLYDMTSLIVFQFSPAIRSNISLLSYEKPFESLSWIKENYRKLRATSIHLISFMHSFTICESMLLVCLRFLVIYCNLRNYSLTRN